MQIELQLWDNGAATPEYVSCEGSEVERPRYGRSVSGYGARLTTGYKVKFRGKSYRVYAACYGNAATLYIGPSDQWIATIHAINGKGI